MTKSMTYRDFYYRIQTSVTPDNSKLPRLLDENLENDETQENIKAALLNLDFDDVT